MVGSVGVGGSNPIRIQSMTVSPTLDTDATVAEAMQLFDAGCEIVRITAQGPKEAKNLEAIRKELNNRGYHGPLVADIHFSPRAAMTAVEYVEKVRINPGNFADTKMFAVREYTDAEYAEELGRIHDSFKPLVLRARELGRAMRIGVNHGSLSDRIMNRYGDTPRGMVESAIEFIKIAEMYDYRDIIVSMKASNPQVMIQAYRMLVERFRLEYMDYPLHLGVTEAGDGKDGRMKSACGIGALLEDGLGDTIRVSLTEDAVYEVPVARALADLYNRFSGDASSFAAAWKSSIQNLESEGLAAGIQDIRCKSISNPYRTLRRKTDAAESADSKSASNANDNAGASDASDNAFANDQLPLGALYPVRAGIFSVAGQGLPNSCEGIDFVVSDNPETLARLPDSVTGFLAIYSGSDLDTPGSDNLSGRSKRMYFVSPSKVDDLPDSLPDQAYCLIISAPDDLKDLKVALASIAKRNPAWLAVDCQDPVSATLAYRLVAELLESAGSRIPLVLYSRPGKRKDLARAVDAHASQELEENASLYRTSIHSGGLLLEGIGDGILVESSDASSAASMALDLLQTTRIRLYRTEYISCPSCGRTLFDLQETTARIKSKTGHLKGVKIAVMGCIVNGPGEMADADFGYVGSAPGKINLYRGKEVVRKNIPSADADQELIDLIREHGMWQDP
tara:strand:+ start:77163 stop:79199 length:2037 start_codon:yes stop_codon:yes gene_type:complete